MTGTPFAAPAEGADRRTVAAIALHGYGVKPGKGATLVPVTLPLRHIVPLGRETQWCDLLAVLVEADPGSVAPMLWPGDCPRAVTVHRERTVDDVRLDLVIDVDDTPGKTVIEAKVLAGLGPDQLVRCFNATPHASHHIVIAPERLTVDIGASPEWREVSWEQLLGAFGKSEIPWVAETARTWLAHLSQAMPTVDAHSRWNDLVLGESFAIALRARMSWVFQQLRPPEPVKYDFVIGGAGSSGVARMLLPAAAPGYEVIAEAEENLPVREYPKCVTTSSKAPRGPSVKVCLLQTGVRTSAGFDWAYLRSLWPLMSAARRDWVTNPPNLRAAHDRENWKAMVDRWDGPRHLGIGFGDAQARNSPHGGCMFGARFQLPPDVELAGVVDALHQTAELIGAMSAAPPPNLLLRPGLRTRS